MVYFFNTDLHTNQRGTSGEKMYEETDPNKRRRRKTFGIVKKIHDSRSLVALGCGFGVNESRIHFIYQVCGDLFITLEPRPCDKEG